MQPGLTRLPDDARHFTPLAPDSDLYREKQAVLQAGMAPLSDHGFDDGAARQAVCEALLGQQIAVGNGGWPALALAAREDIAVLEGPLGLLRVLCVCAPSHWSPEDKLGLSFAQVHAPVADNERLVAAAGPLMRMVTAGGHWERFVWTLTPSPRYDQHPRRQPRQAWADTNDPDAFAAACFLRTERQTFFAVPDRPQQAVFTIRVTLQPLARALASPADAQRLHDALRSMSDAVLDYKHLAPAKERLCLWLRQRIRTLPP
jgi:hypothetical protein